MRIGIQNYIVPEKRLLWICCFGPNNELAGGCSKVGYTYKTNQPRLMNKDLKNQFLPTKDIRRREGRKKEIMRKEAKHPLLNWYR